MEKEFKKRVIRIEITPNEKFYPGKIRGNRRYKKKTREKRWKKTEMTPNTRGGEGKEWK